MKRPSDIVYTFLDKSETTEFLLTPNFNFTERGHVARLVDYSFTDISDSDDDDDDVCKKHYTDPIERLQTQLTALTSQAGKVEYNHRRHGSVQRRPSRHLRERASLKLKVEEDAEKTRNEFVLQRLNDALLQQQSNHCQDKPKVGGERRSSRKVRRSAPPSITDVYDTERPSKRPKLDLQNLFHRLSRKCSVRRNSATKRQSQHVLLETSHQVHSHCLFGFLKMKR